ncbi:FG-GAP-like repeat-containing protein [Dankookia sp. GCM10030260]|uniref:FG-GAP-like repeat-containing protein n=1 Tax=Dankookia sp. GCM10030260 TaxID=3273390 RepID=UPI003612B093
MAQFELNGTSGNDLLDASAFAVSVVLRGLAGDDTLVGGSGPDRLAGANGHNQMHGGGGDDLLFARPDFGEFNIIFGGAGMDTLVLGVTATQYADPAIRAALSQLDYYIAQQARGAIDPAVPFVNATLHLDMVGVEMASVRVEDALAPVDHVVPGAFAVYFDNTVESYQGTDYTLISRWVVDGANFVSGETIAAVERNWQVVGSADFNGDLKADLLWQNRATGAISVWAMDGDTFLNGSTVWTAPVGEDWKVASSGDFNGDGRADILLATTVVDPGTGLSYAGLKLLQLAADGQTLANETALPFAGAGWTVTGTGDFDGDGKTDLLWRDATGNTAVWEMDGATFLRGDTLAAIGLDWSVAGTGDFDGDGRDDILWRNTDGKVAIWEMNGLLVRDGATIYNPGTDWIVAGVADHNGDGRSDILWRHAPIVGTAVTELQVWTMDGMTVAGVGTLGFVANDWQTV